MRYFSTTLVLCGVVLVAPGCESLGAFLATPEGQDAAGQLGRGAANLAANPANPLAWWDIALGGGAIVAAMFGAKKGGQAAKAIGGAIKRKLINPEAAA